MNYLATYSKDRLITLYQRLYFRYPTEADLRQFIQDGESYERHDDTDLN